MFMIHTIKPYGCVNIKEIKKIAIEREKYYLIDNYGWWEITCSTYDYLQELGVEIYERRKCPTT